MEEKKEIWKLLELLNEYEKEVRKSEYYEWEKWIWWPNNLFRRDTRDEEWSHLYSDTADTYVISKKYGFIQRLVEQDKIDIKNLVVKWEMRTRWDISEMVTNEDTSEEWWNEYWTELCLMLLSISDEPIELLCSILK